MKVKTFCKPESIYVEWNEDGAATIERKAYGDSVWSFLRQTYNQYFDDKTVEYGKAYQYRVTVYPTPLTPIVKESRWSWCIDGVTRWGAVYDLYSSQLNTSANAPLLMARIYDTGCGDELLADDVTSIQRQISLIMCNDVVSNPQTMVIEDWTEIEKTKALTSNLIITPEWTVDNYGYNFRMTLDPKTIPNTTGTYLIQVILTVNNTPITLRWIIENTL